MLGLQVYITFASSASNLFYFSINSPNTTLNPFELFSCLLHFRDDESKDKTILNGYLIGFIKYRKYNRFWR